MSESTALEALIGEMLKDVLTLHRSVDELKAELPTILRDVHKIIANLDARASAPQNTAQRELERYISHQFKAIPVAVDEVKKSALITLSAQVFGAVNTGWASAQARADKSFVEVTQRFDVAMDQGAKRFSVELEERAKVVEEISIQMHSKICMDLKNQIDELTSAKFKNTLLHMMGVSVITGLLIGTASVYILK